MEPGGKKKQKKRKSECGVCFWEPQGTPLKDRVFIKSKVLREQISSIFKGHVRPGGVVTGATVPEDHVLAKITEDLEEDETLDAYATLLSNVFDEAEEQEEGNEFFHPYLEILRTLALKSPVCHLVKPHIFSDIRKVIDGEPVLGVLPNIFKHSPMLGRFLRGANGGPADDVIKNLLGEMLQISEKAFAVDALKVRINLNCFFFLIVIFSVRPAVIPCCLDSSRPF